MIRLMNAELPNIITRPSPKSKDLGVLPPKAPKPHQLLRLPHPLKNPPGLEVVFPATATTSADSRSFVCCVTDSVIELVVDAPALAGSEVLARAMGEDMGPQ